MNNHSNPRYFWILLAFLLSFSLSAAPRAPDELPTAESRPDHVPGELLVKFKEQTDAAVQGSFMAELNARDHRPLPLDRVHLIKLPRSADAKAMASLYANDPRIEYAEPNYLYYTQKAPDDPDYINDKLWGLNNTDTPDNDMNAEAAWDLQTDCSSTVVAVVDTGINYTHEDLAANMWDGTGAGYPNHGWDFVDGDPETGDDDPIPTGGASHGTHVAGTIGAVGNNGIGITGVCWQASLMSVRVIGPDGSGELRDIASGIDFAVDQGAKIINMSLGGPTSETMSDAIAGAAAAGVLVVVAAGNGGNDGIGDDNDTTPFYPCSNSSDNIICVAALDQAYELASFSNYGAESVDVGAPGVNIQSAVAGEVITDNLFSGWTSGPAWDVGTDTYCQEYSLFTPTDYCTNENSDYGDDASDTAYKSFDLSSGLIGAGVNMSLEYFIEDDDFLRVGVDPDGADDPFVGGSVIGAFNSPGGGELRSFSYDLTKSNCLTESCSIGLQLLSNDDGITSHGARAYGFHINTTVDGADTYALSNGTSMATPHVAGLAALVWSYNPDYTYADVLGSVVNSGDAVSALDGKTTSGRAVDAYRALKYIQAPTGVSASVQ
ncbi:MAG: S8 family serine peptidase [Thiohalophilus sp.]